MVALHQPGQLAQPVGHQLEYRACIAPGHLLGEAGDAHTVPLAYLPFVGGQFPRDELHQRGLALTVAPDEADALALIDGEVQVVQERRGTKGEGDVLKRYQGHGKSFRERERNRVRRRSEQGHAI
ncbi:MAG: hypothetical protein DSZ01_08220 [Gammaproteobacteria bacterium]|nr:MAG: hypothetical protein DSZ01_08220 [Gammaproteobacteria bacterium]